MEVVVVGSPSVVAGEVVVSVRAVVRDVVRV